MKYILIIIIIICVLSCTVYNDVEKIKFIIPQEITCFMKIPNNYRFERYEALCEEKEDFYYYEDSSFIYISSFKVSPNYNNIKNLGDGIVAYRFQNKELIKEINLEVGREVLKILPDTFELSGLNERGLFWKDIKINNITIGYDNVSKGRKDIFDNALKSFKKRAKGGK